MDSSSTPLVSLVSLVSLVPLVPLVSSLWKTPGFPVEGWIGQSARRYPSGFEPACSCCSAGFRDALYLIFHPANPAWRGEVCRACAGKFCDPDFPLPVIEEAWVTVDLLALEEREAFRGSVPSDSLEGVGEEDEFSVRAQPVQSSGSQPAVFASVPSDFEGQDLHQLEGKNWRISTKGNLFCHQRDFHLVIFPDKVAGFRLMIDGVVGKLIYPSASRASSCGFAAVRELLCRGVMARKLKEDSQGREVSVQQEMPLR